MRASPFGGKIFQDDASIISKIIAKFFLPITHGKLRFLGSRKALYDLLPIFKRE
jgi:hypothetical protein